MKISVTCQCGRSFSTDAKNAGRKTKCPACGSQLTIPEPINLEPVESVSVGDMSLQVKIGDIGNKRGKLSFTLSVHSSGDAHVQIFAFDPSDRRKSGVFLRLGEGGFEQLKTILTKLENTIQNLRSSKRMNDKMAVRLE